MRAVLDVGQYVSATIRADGHPAQVLAAWRDGQFELVRSQPILDDLRRVLAYPRIRKYHRFSDEEIALFVDALALAAQLAPAHLELRGVPDDPTDDKVLACAVEGQAEYIVSSDQHLLKMDGYEQIAIVPPRRFLERLRHTPSR
ncbi:MAG: putative toxin-antitoxin system toxin component, PIN family [Chloroflexi bacterium]|nr:putative toxin-antitoxin system toxin component, PIN family [Chloroflexota bacterium]